jgi:hypothetical protein
VEVLELSHKYDMAITFKICMGSIKAYMECPPHTKPTERIPWGEPRDLHDWCTDVKDPRHVLCWVLVAEELQLDALMDDCLDCIQAGLQRRFHQGKGPLVLNSQHMAYKQSRSWQAFSQH